MENGEKAVETVVVGNYVEMESEGKASDMKSKLSNMFWHGGSVYDAWFSCASNQVAQVLLTLPYSFSQLGMLSGILFQLFYGLLGSWTAYLISILYVEYRTRKEREKVNFRNHVIQWFEVLDGLLGKHWRNVGLAFNCTFLLFGSVIQLIACASNIYYINDNLDKRTWTYIFGACCATTVFIPSFHNYRIWSFLGLLMTTYTAWYLTIASILHGQELFFGGIDTSVNSIQWTMAEIINNPIIADRLREEIDSVVGKSRLIQETDLPNLPYLQAVIKEALRLHPPVPIIPREFNQGCTVGGFFVPGKTRLLVNIFAVMRDPNVWEDPLEFKPERFLTSLSPGQEDERNKQTLKYLPFGGGRRGCPASNLGYMIVGTTIGMMLQCFDWSIKGEKVNMDGCFKEFTETMAYPLTFTPVTRISTIDSETLHT